MSLLFVVLPLAMLLALAALIGFIWSVRQGQFDDLDTPPVRAMLSDDDD
jgi:cbb3-type cytochrome oxidase maturation protein